MAAQDHRGLDLHVAPPAVQPAPEILQLVPDDHPLGIEEGETGALVGDAEQVQFLPQLAVVAALGLLHPLQVLIQVLPAGEGGAIDPLQHLVLLAAPPVGPGDAEQLDGAHHSGAWQVRPPAEVDELPLLVQADLDIGRQVLHEFHLVGLLPQGEIFDRFLAGDLPPHQRVILLDDLQHLRLNRRQVFGGEGVVRVQVVVEAVGDGGADGQLRPREQPLHRLGQNVG